MDVVIQAVNSLGGSVDVTSDEGQGTVFNFRLPVTMTISQALLVKVGSYRFAILSRTIDRVMRIKDDEVEQIDENQYLILDGQQVPLFNLMDKIQVDSLSASETYRSVVIVRVSNGLVAFEVDQFDDTVDIVTKQAGSQLTSIDGITGVTVLADSSVVLIMNPSG